MSDFIIWAIVIIAIIVFIINRVSKTNKQNQTVQKAIEASPYEVLTEDIIELDKLAPSPFDPYDTEKNVEFSTVLA